jgi:hypothetical protein
LGGVPERGIYDNMKTAVDKVGKGSLVQYEMSLKRGPYSKVKRP